MDFVDTLERSRRCMKKDLPELINIDKRLNPQAFRGKDDKEKAMKQETLPDLLSSDMHRKMMRKKWEAEEEEMRSRGPGPLHYQNLKFDEESQWDRVKKQVHEERPQEFAPPQQYNWMMPSMRQTPKKKSKFASTESCDGSLLLVILQSGT
ncbi:coiled-coil domain-containing protein 174-like [Asterias rubens]|uniref:coiled-coil domain-containing protein 174-like n=1 Tax=Asterias rubens TaxID=7604 RepID=UPI0014558DE2|nr:coiled-coil domain-containing protein 174-like [Asterias rubens]